MSNFQSVIYSHQLPHDFGKFSVMFKANEVPQVRFEAFGINFAEVNTVKLLQHSNDHVYITIEQGNLKNLKRLFAYLLEQEIIVKTQWIIDLDFVNAKGTYEVYEYIGKDLATIEKQ